MSRHRTIPLQFLPHCRNYHNMTIRLEIFNKEVQLPGLYQRVEDELKQHIDPDIRISRTSEIYTFNTSQNIDAETHRNKIVNLFSDPVLHNVCYNSSPSEEIKFNWYIESSYKTGVTDNHAKAAIENLTGGLTISPNDIHTCIYSKGFYISTNLDADTLQDVFYRYIVNSTIETLKVLSFQDFISTDFFSSPLETKKLKAPGTLFFPDLNIKKLKCLSSERCLSLSEDEISSIIDYFKSSQTVKDRLSKGLTAPSEVELEAIAQTWSEHCKHKIFNADITYTDENGVQSEIHSLFKTYIEAPTDEIMGQHKPDSWCLSVFKDNAGIIRFTRDINIAFKVETHNSPSAIDPYGGAMTGIVGVNRDSFGTGMGAQLLANTNVLCFGSPTYDTPLPNRIFHPSRVFHGVRKGIEEGGNLSGIPTVNGSVVFDDSFTGKPLVFCGTVSQMPAKHFKQPSENKKVNTGDLVVMVGGRIGKDGIHGATFSSEILTEASPSSAVQIGDPITQKLMFDFLWEAKKENLYSAITDNGAGGLSSSVGEMAKDTNGCLIHLEKAPLKYEGLAPWEILISESQERMTLSVPKQKIDRFLELSKSMTVESTVIGEFNDSGYFECCYKGKTVAYLHMDFLHEGVPKLTLEAKWETRALTDDGQQISQYPVGEILHKILSRPNVCSKESIIRQYDHEVQGGSVIKPLTGADNDGPNDSAVIRPDLNRPEGLVIGHGICPKYSPFDTYHMAACAVDEAVRNIIAVGAAPDTVAGLDNFCWPDPVQSVSTPDGTYKLAQLIRACQALKEICLAYQIPCISGKDSMKNDVYLDNRKISILPTLLFSVVGKTTDIRKAISSDFKSPGDLIYILGETYDECGGSEYYGVIGEKGGKAPVVNTGKAFKRYQQLHASIEKGLVKSAHDCSDGGLAITIAESCIGGKYGAEIELAPISGALKNDPCAMLFSETQSRFIVSVSPEHQLEFEAMFHKSAYHRLGKVVKEPNLYIRNNGALIVSETIESLSISWKKPLKDF